MADSEHLKRLRSGADDWNAWRKAEEDTIPNLTGARLQRQRLSRYDFSGADLSEAVLDGAGLFGSALHSANLDRARLYAAGLCGADLQNASLRNVYLRGADLRESNLRGCDLRQADMRDANLEGANLRGAQMEGANLRGANLRDTDLRNTKLTTADIRGANTNGAKLSDELQRNALLNANPQPLSSREPLSRSASSLRQGMTKIPENTLNRLRKALVEPGDLDPMELAQAIEWYQRYTDYHLKHPDSKWPVFTLVAFIELIKPHLMFKAWATFNDRPFTNISGLCKDMSSLFGMEFFAGRTISKKIPTGKSFGWTLQEMGAVTADDLKQVRDIRADIGSKVKIRLFLGTLLVRQSFITLGEYYQALALHFGVEFTGVNDETVAKIASEWSEFTDLHTMNLDSHEPRAFVDPF